MMFQARKDMFETVYYHPAVHKFEEKYSSMIKSCLQSGEDFFDDDYMAECHLREEISWNLFYDRWESIVWCIRNKKINVCFGMR